jgi:hypothetical protein
MLLILATDALNTGMTFADPARRTLLEIGTLPVLMLTTRVTLFLQHQEPGRLELHATALNGDRREALPVQVVEGGVRFTLDTGGLQGGPTTFFELVESAGSSGTGQGSDMEPDTAGGGGCSLTISASRHPGVAWLLLLSLGYWLRRSLKARTGDEQPCHRRS